MAFNNTFILEESRMEALHSLINAGNDLVWGQLLIYILIGVGLFFTVRMGFMQIRLLPRGWQEFWVAVATTAKAAISRRSRPLPPASPAAWVPVTWPVLPLPSPWAARVPCSGCG